MYSTPEEVYPFIGLYAKDKVFCDLGCGYGKVVEAMKGIAKHSFGIENDPDTANDIYGNFVINLPESEVYYMWIGKPEYTYEKIKDRLKGKILLVGANEGTREVNFVDNFCQLLSMRWCNSSNNWFTVGVIYV